MHDYDRSSNGSVLFEIVLVVPLLLALAFGALQFAEFMSNSEILSVASREGANEAFRECAFLTGQNLIDCLDDNNSGDGIDSVIERTRNIIPSAITSKTDIILNVLTYNSTTNGITISSRAGVVANTQLSAHGYSSHFPMPTWTDTLGRVTATSPVNATNTVVATCEVFYQQPKLFGNMQYFSSSIMEVYEATIF